MKNLYSIIFVLSLLLTIVSSFSACVDECEQTKENRVLIVFDYTDKYVLQKVQNDIKGDLDKIIKAFFPCMECLGGYLKVIQIRDNCQNKARLIQIYGALPSGIAPVEPPPHDYGQFKMSVKKLVDSLTLDTVLPSLGQTCFYEPLCKELRNLTDSNVQGKRVAIIYSDMLENANGISLYQNAKFDAATFEQKLVDKYKDSLPNLDGVQIYIINYRNTKNDNLIRYGCQIWKEVFSSHGAKVYGPDSDLQLKRINNGSKPE